MPAFAATTRPALARHHHHHPTHPTPRQQVDLDLRVDLPQLAVVGAQSAGKSSVLAALVGADFLPRGTGVVTRCPLVLQLVRAPPGTPPTAEFHHAPGKTFVNDFAGVAAEVAAETERRAGGACGIVADPIRLRISSPSVLTMTLVDLPGLARVPMGDQPADVEARVRELCLAYIRALSCVVLAVTPAGADPATSDGLALARAVDPAGDRTLGVLTKVDLMDGGTSAAPLLRGEAPPRLRLGYVAVACRGVAAAAAGATPADERSAEAAFFASKAEYAGLGGVCGVPALARALNRVLADAVRGALPTLASALDDAVAARAAEVARLGDAPPGASAAARGALLLGLLESYARNFSGAIAGTSPTLPLTELAGGARLRHVFQDVFVPAVSGLDPAAELGDGEVRTALNNAGGARGTLLIPDAPFELLTRRAVARLLPPCLACVSLAHAEVLRIAEDALPAGVDRFPSLRRELLASVDGLVAAGAAPAERMVRDLVACELAFINTDHPDFVGGARAVAAAMEARSAAATAAAASPPPRRVPTAAPPSPTKGGLAAALDPPPLRCPSELLGGDASPSRAAVSPRARVAARVGARRRGRPRRIPPRPLRHDDGDRDGGWGHHHHRTTHADAAATHTDGAADSLGRRSRPSRRHAHPRLRLPHHRGPHPGRRRPQSRHALHGGGDGGGVASPFNSGLVSGGEVWRVDRGARRRRRPPGGRGGGVGGGPAGEGGGGEGAGRAGGGDEGGWGGGGCGGCRARGEERKSFFCLFCQEIRPTSFALFQTRASLSLSQSVCPQARVPLCPSAHTRARTMESAHGAGAPPAAGPLLRFCPESNDLLYPQEDKERKVSVCMLREEEREGERGRDAHNATPIPAHPTTPPSPPPPPGPRPRLPQLRLLRGRPPLQLVRRPHRDRARGQREDSGDQRRACRPHPPLHPGRGLPLLWPR